MDVTSQVLGGAPASEAPASNNPTPAAPASGATTANAATPGAPGAPVAGQPIPGAATDPATGDVKASQPAGIETPAPGATGAAPTVAPAPSLVDRLNADDATNKDVETRLTAVETRLSQIIDAHNAREKAAAATDGSGMVTGERFNKLVKAVFGDPNAI